MFFWYLFANSYLKQYLRSAGFFFLENNDTEHITHYTTTLIIHKRDVYLLILVIYAGFG